MASWTAERGMTADVLLSRLERVRSLGQNKWQARCPAHDDTDPSLSITDTGDQVLLYCHAGCASSEVLIAVGLSWTDLHRDSHSSSKAWLSYSPEKKRRRRRISPTFKKARAIWASADPTEPFVVAHPYAQRKGIPTRFGAARASVRGLVVGRDADCLVIPMHDHVTSDFCGVECINVAGQKQTFGNKGCFKVGDFSNPQPIIHVCEGWATLWAASQLFPDDFLGVACFSASRLLSISAFYEAKLPNRVFAHIEELNKDLWDVLQDPEATIEVRRDVLGG